MSLMYEEARGRARHERENERTICSERVSVLHANKREQTTTRMSISEVSLSVSTHPKGGSIRQIQAHMIYGKLCCGRRMEAHMIYGKLCCGRRMEGPVV